MSLFASIDPDWPIRLAAFAELRRLVDHHGPVLPWGVIEQGFVCAGRRYLFANKSKGIFRPAGMERGALSIKTTVPRRGQARRYDDLADNEAFSYKLQARGVGYHDNDVLLWCAQYGVPFIYFFGIEPGHYRPIWPAYVQAVHLLEQNVRVAAAPLGAPLVEPGAAMADDLTLAIERRYATVEVKRRLHQEAFRHLVLGAYGERCAICNLPRRELLDAAHILPDRDARGDPSVPNGLALCKLHHSAFDTNLIGVRPDSVVEVSRTLLEIYDGPTLEVALKGIGGTALRLPRRPEQRPDRAFLEERYETFRLTA